MWSPCCGPNDHDGVWVGVHPCVWEAGGRTDEGREGDISKLFEVACVGDAQREEGGKDISKSSKVDCVGDAQREEGGRNIFKSSKVGCTGDARREGGDVSSSLEAICVGGVRGEGDTSDPFDVCVGDVGREGSGDNTSVVSVGVRMVIAGVWSWVSPDISVVSRGVVPGLEDCCGMDAGLVDIAVGGERVRDGPLTKPSERRSSSWPKPNNQATGENSRE